MPRTACLEAATRGRDGSRLWRHRGAGPAGRAGRVCRPPVIRVWLIRHGASTAPPTSAIGATDPALSKEGRTQADQVAGLLQDRPLVRVVSSDRRRALATARVVAAPHGLPVQPEAALRELDL